MSVGYPKYIEGLKKVRLRVRLPCVGPPPARLLTHRASSSRQYQEAWKAAYAKLPTTPLTPLMPLNPFNPFNVTMPEWPKLEMPSTATATTAGAYPTFGAWTPGWPFVQPTASSQAAATTGTATVETTPAADATAAAATTTHGAGDAGGGGRRSTRSRRRCRRRRRRRRRRGGGADGGEGARRGVALVT